MQNLSIKSAWSDKEGFNLLIMNVLALSCRNDCLWDGYNSLDWPALTYTEIIMYLSVSGPHDQ